MSAANDLNFLLDAIPSNWCDPLLTGPGKVVGDNPDCPAIEALLNAVRKRLKEQIGEAQADIDAFMLEHCPNAMTEAQKAEWQRNQVMADNLDAD